MEGLTIRKKVTPRAKPSKRSISDVLFSGVLVLLLIVLIPLILLAILFSFVWHRVFPEKPTAPTAPRPVVTHEVVNDFFSLRYRCVMGEEISEGATGYFDDEPLILYQPAAVTNFFRGYFSSFKIEYPTGIFVQKVNFDATLSKVVSMPLYFFNYVTQEAEELMDLKGYRLFATEHLNHFTIVATSEEDVEEFAAESFRLEITLTDALYSPPKAY